MSDSKHMQQYYHSPSKDLTTLFGGGLTFFGWTDIRDFCDWCTHLHALYIVTVSIFSKKTLHPLVQNHGPDSFYHLPWVALRHMQYFTMLYDNTIKTYSRSITINDKPSGKFKTRVEVSLSFNSWKPFSQAFIHSNFTFFWVRVVNGEAIDVNPSTNLL